MSHVYEGSLVCGDQYICSTVAAFTLLCEANKVGFCAKPMKYDFVRSLRSMILCEAYEVGLDFVSPPEQSQQ